MRRLHFPLILALAVVPLVRASAQAWSYPSFQLPRVVDREYNIGVADAGTSGTSVVFQWREQIAPRTQISFDGGLADPHRSTEGVQIFGGAQYALQLATSSADVPLDFPFPAGAYLAVGDAELFRIPVGLSTGHRFPLQGGLAITPYAHPRLTLGLCTDCRDKSDLGINFDLGGSLEVSRY